MITGKDIYTVLAAIVPLYVAMFLAYGSVKWWKIFTPAQCSGINRFVAVFAVPLLSFHFISSNNPYAMNYRFIAADSLQKLIILGVLALWMNFGKNGNLEWMITLFSLSTLPNTLVMGIPLLQAMYGEFSGTLMVQIVVLQSVIWYTLMLFMFEYRGGKALIMEQFPETAGSITSFRVESDVVSLDGREPVQADAQIGEDGKLHVVLRKSSTSACTRSANSYKSHGFNSLTSITPRASNLTGVEIYSLQSSREPTPRASSFNHTDFYAMFNGKNNSFMPSPRNGGDVYSVQSSKGPTPRTSNFEEEMTKATRFGRQGGGRSKSGDLVSGGANSYPYPSPNTVVPLSARGGGSSNRKKSPNRKSNEIGNKDLHMFVWSSSASPVSEGNLRHAMNRASSNDYGLQDTGENQSPVRKTGPDGELISQKEHEIDGLCSPNPKFAAVSTCFDQDPQKKPELNENVKDPQMPPASVMTRLILIMVWRKLIRNPNTYSSLIGVVWSLISYRFKIEMPTIIRGSISILSDAGLGMAMFSLGLFMALQPKIIACGKSVALFSMAVRFLTGPAVMAAASIAIGLRGVLLHVAIVQAALPQGIVPFVFAKEYNVHPDILSTAVIFGMLIALPITILYYIILGV